MHSEILDRYMPVDLQLMADYWNSVNASKTSHTDRHQEIAFSTVLLQSFKNILIGTWLSTNQTRRFEGACSETIDTRETSKLPNLLSRYIEEYEWFKESRSNPNKVLIVHPMYTIGHHTDDWHGIPWTNLSRCGESETIVDLIRRHIDFSNKKENTETSLQNDRRTKGSRVSSVIINNTLFQMRQLFCVVYCTFILFIRFFIVERWRASTLVELRLCWTIY